jgi:hypothetical protein
MLKYQLRINKTASDDVNRTRNILLLSAAKFHLTENTEDSRVEKTIISLGDNEHYWDGIGARCVGDDLLVDFNQRSQEESRIDLIYQFALLKPFLNGEISWASKSA